MMLCQEWRLVTGTICAYKCCMIKAWLDLYYLTTWLMVLWKMRNAWCLAPIAHSRCYMMIGVGQWMNATIAKDHTPRCMIQRDIQHGK
jgi:hypothetical protein